jgi:hypothetical protein
MLIADGSPDRQCQASHACPAGGSRLTWHRMRSVDLPEIRKASDKPSDNDPRQRQTQRAVAYSTSSGPAIPHDARLHLAHCETIRGIPARGDTFTGDWIKVCSESLRELDSWAMRHTGSGRRAMRDLPGAGPQLPAPPAVLPATPGRRPSTYKTRTRTRPACCRVRDLVLVPLGSDQGSQRYRAPSPTMAVPGRGATDREL